ncbi:hypothetical protein EVAR_19110_1 [Eumeta japonica]|uniref:Uncharacterized protein n=1 Tax=Eumeta variegata TaxID=151549 RepID=A0A4C1UPK4_EUMVA|nr:hypothetical protein EVAR_19110_1 [Eumeta japonica]
MDKKCSARISTSLSEEIGREETFTAGGPSVESVTSGFCSLSINAGALMHDTVRAGAVESNKRGLKRDEQSIIINTIGGTKVSESELSADY